MGLINSLKSVFRASLRGDAELDYLNQSTSRVELDMRHREVDRGRFRHLPRRG